MNPKIKIAPKKPEETIVVPKPQENFDTKLDAIKFASTVHTRIKQDIKPDFVLSILDDKNKEAVIEMTSNAYFVKRIVNSMAHKLKEKKQQEKDEKTKKLYQKMIDHLTLKSGHIFDSFMTRIYMTVLLNRNVRDNYLLKIMSGVVEPDQITETTEQEPKWASKMLNKLKKQPEIPQ